MRWVYRGSLLFWEFQWNARAAVCAAEIRKIEIRRETIAIRAELWKWKMLHMHD